MEWFKKSKTGISSSNQKKEIKDNLWIKCEGCSEIIYRKELERLLWTCPGCKSHFRINSRVYREILLDEGTFEEMDAGMTSVDALSFKDKKSYADRIVEYRKKSGLNDAVITGVGAIHRRRVGICVMDFSFMGGSMGSVVGEKITRVIMRATREGFPMVIVCSSGGARMQEGALSLMQMAKTSAALALLAEKKLPFIAVLTDPTTGGTTASFAMLGDVIISEPGALVGFAGARVIRETIRQELPKGFQRAEFLMEHGFIDCIVDRSELRETLNRMLAHFMGPVKLDRVKSDLYIDADGNLKDQYQDLPRNP